MRCLNLINLQSSNHTDFAVSHVEEEEFVQTDDTSAVKIVVMAWPLLDLYWAGTRLKKNFMKSA